MKEKLNVKIVNQMISSEQHVKPERLSQISSNSSCRLRRNFYFNLKPYSTKVVGRMQWHFENRKTKPWVSRTYSTKL